MKRREFLKGVTLSGVMSSLHLSGINAATPDNPTAIEASPDMVAIMGGEPAVMLQKALTELGGIEKYVKSGQKVVIKPNIGWDRTPNLAANTNPELVGELVKQCFSAGAKEVVVFDHTCDQWQKCYESSGIEKVAKAAGAKVVPGNDESMYKEVAIPNGVKLKSAKIHEALLACDVWFNVPVLKNHGGAKMTIAMKNLMGIVWDRGFFHRNDLQQCIADACLAVKKPALNIVDAYRVMVSNGPQGRSESDVVVQKTLIVSSDIVAADTASVRMFNQLKPMPLNEVGHIALGEKHKLGTQNIDNLNVKRIRI